MAAPGLNRSASRCFTIDPQAASTGLRRRDCDQPIFGGPRADPQTRLGPARQPAAHGRSALVRRRLPAHPGRIVPHPAAGSHQPALRIGLDARPALRGERLRGAVALQPAPLAARNRRRSRAYRRPSAGRRRPVRAPRRLRARRHALPARHGRRARSLCSRTPADRVVAAGRPRGRPRPRPRGAGDRPARPGAAAGRALRATGHDRRLVRRLRRGCRAGTSTSAYAGAGALRGPRRRRRQPASPCA